MQYSKHPNDDADSSRISNAANKKCKSKHDSLDNLGEIKDIMNLDNMNLDSSESEHGITGIDSEHEITGADDLFDELLSQDSIYWETRSIEQLHTVFKPEFINYDIIHEIITDQPMCLFKYISEYHFDKLNADIFYDHLSVGDDKFDYLLEILIDQIDLYEAFKITLDANLSTSYVLEKIIKHTQFPWDDNSPYSILYDFINDACIDDYNFISYLEQGAMLFAFLKRKHLELEFGN